MWQDPANMSKIVPDLRETKQGSQKLKFVRYMATYRQCIRVVHTSPGLIQTFPFYNTKTHFRRFLNEHQNQVTNQGYSGSYFSKNIRPKARSNTSN